MKILIMSLDFELGGFTKSLFYLLDCLRKYDITVDLLQLLPLNSNSKATALPDNTRLVHFKLTDDFIRKQMTFRTRLTGILFSRRIFYKLKRILLNKTVYRKTGMSKVKAMKLYQTDDILKLKAIKGCLDLTGQYDCVISWCEQFPDYFLADKVIAERRIGWIHPDYIGAGFNAEIDAAMLTKLDTIAVVAESCRASLIKSLPQLTSKVACVPNRVSVDLVRNMSVEPTDDSGVCQNRFKLVTVARLQNISKALDRAVRIAAALKAMGLNFSWQIIGDGQDKDMLIKMITAYELQEYVFLVGSKDNPYPYMKNADLFVLQSYYEGKPVAVDEAMILGTPVLVTDYTSAREQLEGGRCGFIVENSEAAITEKLAGLIRTPALLEPVKDYLRVKDWSALEDCSEFIKLIKG